MKQNQAILSLAALALLIGFGWYFTAKTGSFRQEPIRIAFLAPLSGETAVFGENQKKGIDLAVEQINRKGGIQGRKIKIIEEDTQCDPKLSTAAAQKVIEVDKVVAIIGDTCSSSVLAIEPIATLARVPLITPSAGADSLSGLSPYVFRNFIANNEYASFGAKYVRDVLKKERVAVLYINNAYGENMADVFAKSWKGSIVLSQGYDAETKDFRSLLAKVKAAQPDLIYLAGYYNDGALTLKQARELDIRNPFFGSGDAYDDPEFIKLAGIESTEGFIYLSVPTASGPIGTDFRKSFAKKYGQDVPIYSDYAYDTVSIIAYAIEQILNNEGEVSGAAIASVLRDTEISGASGIVKFDDSNNLVRPTIIVKKIENGIATTQD